MSHISSDREERERGREKASEARQLRGMRGRAGCREAGGERTNSRVWSVAGAHGGRYAPVKMHREEVESEGARVEGNLMAER